MMETPCWGGGSRHFLLKSYFIFVIILQCGLLASDASEPYPRETDVAIRMPAQPPGEAPSNLFCRQGGQQEIIVEWQPPSEASWNGLPVGYYVFYKVASFGDDTEKVREVQGKDTRTVTLTNLAYYKQYRVKMAAKNEIGGGKNSSAFYVTTLQGVPSVPPGNVVVSSPNSTTIRLEWDPPPSRLINGKNMGYLIQLTQGFSQNTITVAIDDANPTGRQLYDISGLQKYTDYRLTIACRTATDPGPYSPQQTVRTLEDVPGEVQNLVIDNIRDSSLRINWSPPLERNGVLTGYRITYMKVLDPASLKEVLPGPDDTTWTISDLDYKTTYNLSVQAKTQVGLGPSSVAEIESGVPPELPGPPVRLATANIESRSMTLQFTPGYDGKTIITLWIVEAQTGDDTEWRPIYNMSKPSAVSIKVLNLRPYTLYRLRILAQNIVDKSVASEPCQQFQTLQEAPGVPPDDVTPRAISPTAIRIRWRQIPRSQWNGQYLRYKILYRRWSLDVDNSTSASDLAALRETRWTEVKLLNGSIIQEHNLTGLEEFMSYQIQMVSYNARGSSAPSGVKEERTQEDVPSESPTRVRLLATSSTTVAVTWGPVPVLEQNGNIIGYKVRYVPQFHPDVSAHYLEVKGQDTQSVTLTNLRKFTDYDVQVLAYSRMGDGELSDISKVKTAGDVPGPPINVYFPSVTETSATIVWQTPAEENGIILDYKVTWRLKDDDTGGNTGGQQAPEDFREYLPRATRQLAVSPLTPDSFYVFSVSARTEDGRGNPAVVEVYTTDNRGPPDSPFNLAIDQSKITARNVTITWIHGKTNFSPIRKFTVSYRQREGNWTSLQQPVAPHLTQYTVPNLRPYSWYKFRVSASNDVGSSPWSDASPEVPTKQDVPDGAPQNVRVVALTRTSMKITWTPPPASTYNGYMVSDVVQYRDEEGGEAYREVKVSWGQNACIKTGLSVEVKYEIRVKSCNTVGCGPPSQLVVFRVGDIVTSPAPTTTTLSTLQPSTPTQTTTSTSTTAPIAPTTTISAPQPTVTSTMSTNQSSKPSPTTSTTTITTPTTTIATSPTAAPKCKGPLQLTLTPDSFVDGYTKNLTLDCKASDYSSYTLVSFMQISKVNTDGSLSPLVELLPGAQTPIYLDDDLIRRSRVSGNLDVGQGQVFLKVDFTQPVRSDVGAYECSLSYLGNDFALGHVITNSSLSELDYVGMFNKIRELQTFIESCTASSNNTRSPSETTPTPISASLLKTTITPSDAFPNYTSLVNLTCRAQGSSSSLLVTFMQMSKVMANGTVVPLVGLTLGSTHPVYFDDDFRARIHVTGELDAKRNAVFLQAEVSHVSPPDSGLYRCAISYVDVTDHRPHEVTDDGRLAVWTQQGLIAEIDRLEMEKQRRC